MKSKRFLKALAAPFRFAAGGIRGSLRRQYSVTGKTTLIYGLILSTIFAFASVLLVLFYKYFLTAQIPDADEAASLLTPVIAFVALIMPLGIALTLIIGTYVMRGMLKPVRRMVETARKINESSLSTRIESDDGEDELSDLAKVLNEMLDRLEDVFERQHNFISDAAHELRTPIAVVRGYSDMLTRWGMSRPDLIGESIQAISAETRNMQNLVDKLLFIARADKRTLIAQPVDFYLDELVAEIVKETRLYAPRKIRAGQLEALTVRADRELIKEAVRAFVENSVKYTDDGVGKVTLSCYGQDDGTCAVVVSDNGIGIAKEDMPHIFERFYKCDRARKRTGGGSAGLGLAIAKWIAEAHNADITVDSEPDVGTTVKLLLKKSEGAMQVAVEPERSRGGFRLSVKKKGKKK